MQQMFKLIIALTFAVNFSSLAVAEAPAKLHMFIENDNFFALNGSRMLDVDLTTGTINLVVGDRTVLNARLNGQHKRAGSKANTGGVDWVGSVDVQDGQAIRKARASVSEDVEDIERLGGSWLLAYEYKKWANDLGTNKHAPACDGQLSALIRSVLEVMEQCQLGGGPGCDSALEEMDEAMHQYLQCVEQLPVE